MTTTSVKVKLDLLDDFKPLASVSTDTTLAPFSDVESLLPLGSVYKRPFASFEPDFWLLDGTFVFRSDSDSPPAGTYLSDDLSDAVGDFDTPPDLWIELSAPQDITALTVYFDEHSDEWASIEATYYDAVDAVLATDASDGASVQVLPANVNGVSKIKLVFAATSVPYRRLRITAFDFGEIIWFTGADVIEASAIEECRPLSDELPIGTLSLRLISAEDDFNILDPQGVYVALNEGRSVTVYETVDGADVLIGRFFLDEWENTGDREIRLECIDWIGVMDRITTRRVPFTPFLSSSPTLEDVVEYFLGDAGIDYDIDASIVSDTGNISDEIISRQETLREKIQKLAFVWGVTVECTRSLSVKFYPTIIAADATPDVTITAAEQGINRAVELKPQIASVTVEHLPANLFIQDDETALDQELAAGSYVYEFDRPKTIVSTVGAAGTSIGRFYIDLLVPTTDNVTLVVRNVYGDEREITTVVNPASLAGTRIDLRITGLPISASIAGDVAQRVYDYYSQRYVQTCRLFAPDVVVGQVVVVETLRGESIQGLIEKMEIDLARGMVADVEIRGVVYVEA